MKLVFGKGKVSREEIEQDAAREIETMIASGEDRPAIDWSVYGLSSDVADPAIASAGLGARAADMEREAAAVPAVPPTNGHTTAKPRRATSAKPSRTRSSKPRAAKKPTA